MKNNIHVIFKDEEWKIKEENKEEYIKNFNTKEDAVNYAKELAKKNKVELIIHNQNNIISQKDSYGNDSYPPEG